MTEADHFDLVVAMDDDRGIGVGGALPWRIQGDMAHFKRLTQATESPARINAVLMGRKTWDSIPARFRPLAGRCNVVLSRNPELALPRGVERAASLDEALSLVREKRAAGQIETLFVIGGGAVYAEALARPECRRLYVTRVHKRYACDTVFPELKPAFVRSEVLFRGHDTGPDGDIDYDIDYDIELWQRRI